MYNRQAYDENSLASKIKRWMEADAYKKRTLLILVLIGTCMTIGDGIFTPAISGNPSTFLNAYVLIFHIKRVHHV